MNSKTEQEDTSTLINRGLTLNIRSINNSLTDLFRKYSIINNKISGNGLIGHTQVFKVHSNSLEDNSSYFKGNIVFKNSIDKLQFLLENRNQVANIIGVSSFNIFKNRRNLTFINECISKIDAKYDLGDVDQQIQMFISRSDDNQQLLENQNYWSDYILTQSWIDKLTERSMSYNQMNVAHNIDHRIEYLSDIVYEMMFDHENEFHKKIDSFDESKFLDNVNFKTYYIDETDEHEPIDNDNKVLNAENKLNSFNKLNYCFYEIFKPIGGTDEKYLKIKLFTDGTLDIQGVVGLTDCNHVPWDYGKNDYLRSLNTGNQRYEFKLTIPFNDFNSILWWKPDEKEELEKDEDDTSDEVKYRYYKPYEIERFLRWFGTNYIPMFDMNSISKKTICSIPQLSNDIQTSKFYQDATHILNPDLNKANIDSSTSLSLLSLAQKSSIDLVEREDGQYLVFVVTGHQQTSNISFHITGKMLQTIQELNHYEVTIERVNETLKILTQGIYYIEMMRAMTPQIDDVWNLIQPSHQLLPSNWTTLWEQIYPLASNPTIIDLLRLRQIDFDVITNTISNQIDYRKDIIKKLTKDSFKDSIEEPELFNSELEMKLKRLIRSNIYNENLEKYIFNFPNLSDEELFNVQNSIELASTTKDEIHDKLLNVFNIMTTNFDFSFEPTVDDIRARIETFNNLIVRLPVDTYTNKITSLHIFQDWKNFIDKALEYLCDNGLLYKGELEMEYGTDGIPHTFNEYYIDRQMTTPLINYDYRWELNELGERTENVIHDRWDFWTENDFK